VKTLNINKILIFLITAVVVCAPFTLASFINCDDVESAIREPKDNPSSILYLLCPLQSAIWLGLYFVGAVLIIMILYGGIKALMSTGDAKQLEGAKMVWTYAVLGVLVVLLAIFIVQVAFRLLGSTNNPLNFLYTIGLAFDQFLICLKDPLSIDCW
jgi:Na+/proline symporter